MDQLVERRTRTLECTGSNPVQGTCSSVSFSKIHSSALDVWIYFALFLYLTYMYMYVVSELACVTLH